MSGWDGSRKGGGSRRRLFFVCACFVLSFGVGDFSKRLGFREQQIGKTIFSVYTLSVHLHVYIEGSFHIYMLHVADTWVYIHSCIGISLCI